MFVLGAGAPQIATAQEEQEWNTFYSPEKKFSIDYTKYKSKALNITEIDDQIAILTGPLNIRVGIMETIITIYPIQQSVYAEIHSQNQGNTITETTHPITINGKKGYSFTDMYTVEDFDGTIINDHIFMRHGDKTYMISLQYDISHVVMAQDEILHTIESIKFFD
jgi:hypothetical protein